MMELTCLRDGWVWWVLWLFVYLAALGLPCGMWDLDRGAEGGQHQAWDPSVSAVTRALRWRGGRGAGTASLGGPKN